MNPTNPHIVIYSHGFGVRKDDRGLFRAVAKAMPEATHILFDYSPFNASSKTLTVKPFNEQAQKLRKVINTARADHPGAVIDLVCHGQGCVPVGILKPRDIRKIIMIAPPDDVSETVLTAQLSAQLGATIDVETRIRIAQPDGDTVVVRPEYWQGLADIIPVKLYNRLAKFTKLRIINARHDEVLTPRSFERLDPGISAVTLDGGHDFAEGESRSRLLHILQKELAV